VFEVFLTNRAEKVIKSLDDIKSVYIHLTSLNPPHISKPPTPEQIINNTL